MWLCRFAQPFVSVTSCHRCFENAPCQRRLARSSTACHLDMIPFSLLPVYALSILLCINASAQSEKGDLSLHALLSKGPHLATRPSSVAKSALITPPPQVQPQAIVARADLATCGYVSGNAGLPCAFSWTNEGACQTDLSYRASVAVDMSKGLYLYLDNRRSSSLGL